MKMDEVLPNGGIYEMKYRYNAKVGRYPNLSSDMNELCAIIEEERLVVQNESLKYCSDIIVERCNIVV